jgi:hypothetical protein
VRWQGGEGGELCRGGPRRPLRWWATSTALVDGGRCGRGWRGARGKREKKRNEMRGNKSGGGGGGLGEGGAERRGGKLGWAEE